ncbi:ubiquinone biosynthesis O-methyltransferase-like isoform X1 [Maniola jurtina]|uniref:ubiquinone biosynthesis O-methyltransferase-like isoform X1 n=1 Tax=Maniola jurtina TaxID=191418 RepID=UPI001E689159|nr:ubiquinone biosynthesis O-methyltransferase-like isoform X1 [Maniola jurtina]
MTKMSAKLLYELHTCSVKTLLFRRWVTNARFSNNIHLNSKRNAHTTIEAKDYFQANKGIQWDPEGPLKPLYTLNYLRVPYIRDSLVNVAPGEKFSTCLKGKKILDVGCGGGFLSEALAKLGAEVTGIDTNKEALEHTKKHSSNNMRLANNLPAYIPVTIEEHCKEYAESYDVVVSSEVIDHVAQKELFVESCVRAAKPGAKLFFTTINRTRLAQFVIIFCYENIVKTIPKGAHDFNMFIKPSELKYMLEMNDCFVESTKGYMFYPFDPHWVWTKHKMFFYAIEAVKSN